MSHSGHIVRAAAALTGLALLAVTLLSGTERLTRDRIADARAQAELDALSLVLQPSLYDNPLATDRIKVSAPQWLGSDQPLTVWRARRDGVPAALILQAVARDGYSGPIDLRIGVDHLGRVTGVRVVAHQETPGLGDAIEAQRSDWIDGFTGRSLDSPAPQRWAVRRDGGDFDQFAGATITPRAVVRAVRTTLAYVQRHGPALFAAPTDSTLEHLDGP